ncbi:MAG: hypothetical protein Q8N83_00130 [Ignavibacteria bacterium]|nr:hypothetical protein [Ignavibacteria bacterium]
MTQLKNIFCIIYFGLTLFPSCTLVTEPERFYNHNAYPPEYSVYNFDELKPGQHVDGTIKIVFNYNEFNYKVDAVRPAVDGKVFSYSDLMPYTFYLNTRNYPEGNHKITFNVYQNAKPHGLLHLIANPLPSSVFEATLYFDRTPPDTVHLSLVSDKDKEIILNWTESNCETFYSYLIYKSIDGNSFKHIATVSDKSITSYTDTTGLDLVGMSYKYKVNVTTDYLFKYQTESNVEEYILGDPFIYEFTRFFSGPFFNEKELQIYFIVDNKFVSFSSVDNRYINEIDLTGLRDNNEFLEFTLNKEKSKIYLYNFSTNKLWVINSSDLSVIKKVNLPEYGRELFVLDNSRVFVFGSGVFNIFNIDTNTLENSLPLSYNYIPSSAVLNENTLHLIINVEKNNSWRLDVMDVTNNDFNIIDSGWANNQYLSMKKGGDKLYCDAKWIYDINTLKGVGYINSDDYIKAFSVSDQKIALLQDDKYITPGFDEVLCNKITLFDNQINKIKEWKLRCGFTLALGGNKVFASIDRNHIPRKNILGFSLKFGE